MLPGQGSALERTQSKAWCCWGLCESPVTRAGQFPYAPNAPEPPADPQGASAASPASLMLNLGSA